jgi:hypothetical protein
MSSPFENPLVLELGCRKPLPASPRAVDVVATVAFIVDAQTDGQQVCPISVATTTTLSISSSFWGVSVTSMSRTSMWWRMGRSGIRLLSSVALVLAADSSFWMGGMAALCGCAGRSSGDRLCR